MSRLHVRNTCIAIHPYSIGECPDMEKNFRIWNPATHRFDDLGMFYDENSSTLYLPRGIDIWRIKKYLHEKDQITEPPNQFKYINNIGIKYGPKDEEQIEALKFMLGLDQYVDNELLPQLSLNLSTGKGKTYCSIATISYMKIKSVIITDSVTLLNQWKEEIMKYTNLTDKDIVYLSGSSMMNMALSDKSQKMKNASIFLLTHGTIRSYCTQYGWDKLNEIFKLLGIGMKIIDEAHTNFANMLMIDFFTNVYKTYYVTATPKRSDWREDRIYQLAIKNVPFIDLFDADNDPHTDYLAIKFNSKPTAMQISACKNMYGLDRNKYTDYVTNQPNFYKALRIVMDIVLRSNGRALFYIGTNKSILRVYNWLNENYPELIGQIGIYTSLLSKEDKLKEKEKKFILSNTKSAGKGEHIEHLKMTIVLAEPFKSEVLARQSLGRTRDKDTVYIELVDMAFRYVQKYYYSKLRIFNVYAKSTSDTMIDQYELDKRSERVIEERNKLLGAINPLEFRDRRFDKGIDILEFRNGENNES